MDIGTVGNLCRETVHVLIMTSAPILVGALVIGVIISLFQALTQIQESSLTFVPKIIIFYLSMLIITPYIFSKLQIFMDHVVQYIIA